MAKVWTRVYRNGLPFIPKTTAEDGLPFEHWDGQTFLESDWSIYTLRPSKRKDQLISTYGPGGTFYIRLNYSQLIELYWRVRRVIISFQASASITALATSQLNYNWRHDLWVDDGNGGTVHHYNGEDTSGSGHFHLVEQSSSVTSGNGEFDAGREFRIIDITKPAELKDITEIARVLGMSGVFRDTYGQYLNPDDGVGPIYFEDSRTYTASGTGQITRNFFSSDPSGNYTQTDSYGAGSTSGPCIIDSRLSFYYAPLPHAGNVIQVGNDYWYAPLTPSNFYGMGDTPSYVNSPSFNGSIYAYASAGVGPYGSGSNTNPLPSATIRGVMSTSPQNYYLDNSDPRYKYKVGAMFPIYINGLREGSVQGLMFGGSSLFEDKTPQDWYDSATYNWDQPNNIFRSSWSSSSSLSAEMQLSPPSVTLSMAEFWPYEGLWTSGGGWQGGNAV